VPVYPGQKDIEHPQEVDSGVTFAHPTDDPLLDSFGVKSFKAPRHTFGATFYVLEKDWASFLPVRFFASSSLSRSSFLLSKNLNEAASSCIVLSLMTCLTCSDARKRRRETLGQDPDAISGQRLLTLPQSASRWGIAPLALVFGLYADRSPANERLLSRFCSREKRRQL
jgi:hypothetical protein